MATRRERLDEFFRRLQSAPAARSFDEGFGRLSRILNEVEDELSGIEYNLQTAAADGRMYPPTWKNTRRHPTRPMLYILLSRGHVMMVAKNGAMEISERVAGRRVFDRPGEDGRRVDDL